MLRRRFDVSVVPKRLRAGSMDFDCEFDGTVLEWNFENGEWDFIASERICTQALE
jgi:hypothetical protein